MADGKIYITISDERGGKQPTPANVPEAKKEKDPSLWNYATDHFVRFLENQAQQAVNYTINNIGNFTGNYVAQANVSAGVNLINSLKNIGIAAAAGAKFGGYGALIGAGIAVATQVINYGYSEYSNQFALKKQNREIEILRDLSGLNTLTNGSRI